MPPGHIEELAASISEFGVLQPITVRYVKDANGYRIITGECRFTAARHAGLSEIPCCVRSPDHDRILLEQIVENWHRLDLNAFELADSLAMIRDANGLTQQALAEQTGKSAGEVSRLLAILDLPPEVQSVARADESGRISKRHLYALRVFPEAKQLKLLERIQDGRYTAESLELLASSHSAATQSKGKPPDWQSRSFRTKQADVRIVFHKPDVEPEDVLQAIREVRQIILEEGC